jgi:hypothetical protein
MPKKVRNFIAPVASDDNLNKLASNVKDMFDDVRMNFAPTKTVYVRDANYIRGVGDDTVNIVVQRQSAPRYVSVGAPINGADVFIKVDGSCSSSFPVYVSDNSPSKTLINGQSAFLINVPYGYVNLVSDGTAWYVLSASQPSTDLLQPFNMNINTITSAATITVTSPYHFTTGTTTVSTIIPPSTTQAYRVVFFPGNTYTFSNTSGNILNAYSATVNNSFIATYVPTSAKWVLAAGA